MQPWNALDPDTPLASAFKRCGALISDAQMDGVVSVSAIYPIASFACTYLCSPFHL
jgi:hypothetical protein